MIHGSFQRLLQSLGHHLELLKVHLCLYIGLSAVFGHVMARQGFFPEALFTGGSVFILACGSAVLNNIQDIRYDRLFYRTCDRSLPRKRVSLPFAKIMAASMMGFGLTSLFLVSGEIPLLWGAAAVICYNLLYTPLKKRTLLAILPGSLCGMIPPLIGWTAGGKAMVDPHILMIMIVFGLWQMPHFFVLLLRTGQPHHLTTGMKVFPVFTAFYSRKEIKLQVLLWTSLYSLSLLLFLMKGFITDDLLSFLSGLVSVGITLVVSALLAKNKPRNISLAWAAINLSILFFMGTGIYDTCFL